MLKSKNIYIIPFLGFMAIILVGWIALILPFSNNGNISIFDSFFTSCSATCVNGLSTVNISKEYTFIGQVIIALIIEIGAIGFITFVSFILSMRKKRLKLSETLMLSNALNEYNYNKLKQRLKEVLEYTLIIELIGSIFLSIKFIPLFGIKNGIWYSIFHSISAFCNAGFDLFGEDGFTIFADDVYVNIIVMMLMILGSVGFFVIEELIKCIKKRSFIHLGFNTKIVLTTTLILYLISVVLIKILQPDLTIMQVMFTSITARTTGLSTVNMENINTVTEVVISILMIIGGAPGSTSGGIRITSIAIIVLVVFATLKNKKDITVFYKKIDIQTIRQAVTNIFISILIVTVSVIIFVKIHDIGLAKILFMCISAFSATGLAVMNVASLELNIKVLLAILMFIGRVGPISVLSIFIFTKKENKSIEYVKGNVML